MREDELTYEEIIEVAKYTVRKIKAYPERWRKDTSYFEILFPCELKDYLMRRDISRMRRDISRLRREEVTT
jgi:hypothetical protein